MKVKRDTTNKSALSHNNKFHIEVTGLSNRRVYWGDNKLNQLFSNQMAKGDEEGLEEDEEAEDEDEDDNDEDEEAEAEDEDEDDNDEDEDDEDDEDDEEDEEDEEGEEEDGRLGKARRE